jgi:hypothetical protein
MVGVGHLTETRGTGRSFVAEQGHGRWPSHQEFVCLLLQLLWNHVRCDTLRCVTQELLGFREVMLSATA